MVAGAVWMAGSTLARAANGSAASEPCAAAAGFKLDELEKQRLDLEQAVATSKSKIEELASTNGTSESQRRAQQDLAADQVQLIDVLYRIECFRPDMERNDEVLRG